MEKRLFNKVMGAVMGVLPFYLFTLLPLPALAGSVKSPNGNVELKFSVDNTGRPVYEMSYKGREVVKPSFLGLLSFSTSPSEGGRVVGHVAGSNVVRSGT